MTELPLDSAIEAQIDRLSGYCSGKLPALNTGVTYYSQRNNYTMPHRTCNSSANAMYLDWVRRATHRTPLGGDDGYLEKVLSIGDTIEHWVQTAAIKSYGFSTQWRTDGNYDLVCELLKSGFPVVVNILHRGTIQAPRGGHMITLIGRRSDCFIAHDPYGSLSSDYNNTDGAYNRIPDKIFKARWQGGYRTLA